MRVGIDLMGADSPPEFLFEGILKAASEQLCEFVVYATQEIIEALEEKADGLPILFHPVTQVIEMQDLPDQAIRRKQDSSMVVGINALKQGEIDALISCGNTGALIFGCVALLSRAAFCRRPGLLVAFPSLKGEVSLIDVGGNVGISSEGLVDFARMGIGYQRWATQKDHIRVGLLNIGVEPLKGTEEMREAYQLLKSWLGNSFIGNVEPGDIFAGNADVVVAEGVTGNVFLKTAEGFANTVLQELKMGQKTLNKFLQPDAYAGALICGIPHIVIKCHGSCSPLSIYQSIVQSIHYVKKGLIRSLDSPE